MRLTDLYSSTSPKSPPEPQATAEPASSARDTAPKANLANHAVTVSWLGVVLAVIALRVVYEVSE